MHGLSNDFALFDARNSKIDVPRDVLTQWANRRTGIGFDQAVFLKASTNPHADVLLDMYNADGSSLEACGNATRCVASYLMNELNRDEVTIETVAGLLVCKAEAGNRNVIMVDMGVPRFGWRDIPLARDMDTLSLDLALGDLPSPVAVGMGNPHCVFFVDDVDALGIEALGRQVEHDPLFPNRTNVEFARILDRNRIRMRVWERGTGVTAACGSGACATVAAAVRRGIADRRCEVVLDGGTLAFHWRESDDHLLMTGPVAYVFRGEIGA
ncbi:MAG: diaminopimelate epimerase [Alphaproteobacteria bacterium]|nr:diaminopimelate epimerase [Alphaproteobacteria bacterium]